MALQLSFTFILSHLVHVCSHLIISCTNSYSTISHNEYERINYGSRYFLLPFRFTCVLLIVKSGKHSTQCTIHNAQCTVTGELINRFPIANMNSFRTSTLIFLREINKIVTDCRVHCMLFAYVLLRFRRALRTHIRSQALLN